MPPASRLPSKAHFRIRRGSRGQTAPAFQNRVARRFPFPPTAAATGLTSSWSDRRLHSRDHRQERQRRRPVRPDRAAPTAFHPAEPNAAAFSTNWVAAQPIRRQDKMIDAIERRRRRRQQVIAKNTDQIGKPAQIAGRLEPKPAPERTPIPRPTADRARIDRRAAHRREWLSSARVCDTRPGAISVARRRREEAARLAIGQIVELVLQLAAALATLAWRRTNRQPGADFSFSGNPNVPSVLKVRASA